LLLWAGKDEYDDYEQWLKDNPEGTAEDMLPIRLAY